MSNEISLPWANKLRSRLKDRINENKNYSFGRDWVVKDFGYGVRLVVDACKLEMYRFKELNK